MVKMTKSNVFGATRSKFYSMFHQLLSDASSFCRSNTILDGSKLFWTGQKILFSTEILTIEGQWILFFLLWYIWFLSDWSRQISSVHVALPKQTINQFEPVQQSRQQALRPYCSNIYTVPLIKIIYQKTLPIST